MGLFHFFTAIPDMIFGIIHWPKLTMSAIGVGILAGAVSLMFREDSSAVPVVEQKEQVKERRIVRFAKWMWERD